MSRLTLAEHAAIKGIPAQIVAGLSQSMAHAVCGQSVDVRPVRALGERLGHALLAWPGGKPTATPPGGGGRDRASGRGVAA